MRKVLMLAALLLVLGLTLVQMGCSSDDDPVEPKPDPCSIVMTAPAGGGEYFTGDDVSIRWDETGSAAQVKIELLKGNIPSTISSSYNNTGFYPWTVQTYGQSTGDNYSLRVTAVGDDACTDQTANFRIVDLANCNILFPYDDKNPIGTLLAGDTFPIEWTSTNTSGTVRLELWTTSFAPAFTPQEPHWIMAEDLPDTGGYLWTVNSFNFSDDAVYRWRIFDSHDDGCTRTSYFFRLVDNDRCDISVDSIGEDQKLTPGETVNVDIVFTNGGGLVDIELYAGEDRVPGPNIATGFDPSSGSFQWVVSDNGYTGPDNTKYYLHVESHDDAYCTGLSERFTINR